MTLLGHGVHITPPQPIEEAIAWHTVPAQLSALRKQLRDAETSRQARATAVDEHLEKLKWDFTVWLKTLQKQSAEEASTLGQRLDGLEQAGQAQFLVLQERLDEVVSAQESAFIAIEESFDRLDKAQQARLDDERALAIKQIDLLQQQLTAAHSTLQVTGEYIGRLEQAPLKRFWRWLTSPWRKNGPTL